MNTSSPKLLLPLALLLVCCAEPTVAVSDPLVDPAGKAEPDDLAGAVKNLSSRFRRDRERALGVIVAAGKDALPTLVALLDSDDARLRRLAATGLERLKRPEARSALLVRLAKETDARLVDHFVDALVVYGADAWAVIKARGKSEKATASDRRAFQRFLWRYSVQVVQRTLKENTDASGNFKGFYDGQFEDLAAIGPETGSIMIAIMNDHERFPLSLRQIAVRAMAEVGGRDYLDELIAFHKRMSDELGIDDPLRHPEPERVLKTYARYVLARLGNTEASMEQIQYLRQRMRAEMRWRRPGHAALYQWELAYEYHQVRNFERAKREYHVYLNDFPKDKLTVGNSRHVAYYNLCCICSLQSKVSKGALEARGIDAKDHDPAKLKAQAIRYLEKAFEENYTDFYWLTVDRDLDAIRDLPAFKAVVAKQRAKFIPKFEGAATEETKALEAAILVQQAELSRIEDELLRWRRMDTATAKVRVAELESAKKIAQRELQAARTKLTKLGNAADKKAPQQKDLPQKDLKKKAPKQEDAGKNDTATKAAKDG